MRTSFSPPGLPPRSGARTLAALLFVALYVVALGTADGRRIDSDPIEYDVGSGPVVRALHDLLDPITWLTMGAASVLIVVWAYRRRGAGGAIRFAGAMTGAYVSLIVFEVLLQRVDPVGGETLRRLGEGSYPSGHATAVAVLALTAVTLAPRRARPLAAVAAGGFVVLVGVALVVIHAHYPSDVLGGWLLAFVWCAGVATPAPCRTRARKLPWRRPPSARGGAVPRARG